MDPLLFDPNPKNADLSFDSRMRAGLERLWVIFRPYADEHFVVSIRDAEERTRRFGTAGPERDKAFYDFYQRYWEMRLGCELLARNLTLVPMANRPKSGPDFLVDLGSKRAWIECVSPGPGMGADSVPDPHYESDGSEITYMPEDEIKLRLLAALNEKHKQLFKHTECGIVQNHDAYIVAINGHSISPLITVDHDPPRIARVLLGVGQLAVAWNSRTGFNDQVHYHQQPHVTKRSQAQVSSEPFWMSKYSAISGVLYSDCDGINEFNPSRSKWIYVQNPLATTVMASGWIKECECWTADPKTRTVSRQ